MANEVKTPYPDVRPYQDQGPGDNYNSNYDRDMAAAIRASLIEQPPVPVAQSAKPRVVKVSPCISPEAQAMCVLIVGMILAIAAIYFYNRNTYVTVAFSVVSVATICYSFYLASISGDELGVEEEGEEAPLVLPPPRLERGSTPKMREPAKRKQEVEPVREAEASVVVAAPTGITIIIDTSSGIAIIRKPPFRLEGSVHELVDRALSIQGFNQDAFETFLTKISPERRVEYNEQWQNALHYALMKNAPVALIKVLFKYIHLTTEADLLGFSPSYYAVKNCIQNSGKAPTISVVEDREFALIKELRCSCDESTRKVIQWELRNNPQKFQMLADFFCVTL